jgi:hypothetical protein
MGNQICELVIADHRLNPAEAELRITIYPQSVTPTTAVRGRLMGPRCLYATTVEVAYPLRPHSRHESCGSGSLTARVIIPEPSLWEPETPFLYQGPVELCEDDSCCDQTSITHGLRLIQLGQRGLRLNGRPLTVRGVACTECSEDEAVRLRGSGYNTLLAPVKAHLGGLCEVADRRGFLVLGCLSDPKESFVPAAMMCGHPSFLGWLLTPAKWDANLVEAAVAVLADEQYKLPLGIRLSETPPVGLPGAFSFIACEQEALPALASLCLPKLLLRIDQPRENGNETALTPPIGILGWIDGKA